MFFHGLPVGANSFNFKVDHVSEWTWMCTNTNRESKKIVVIENISNKNYKVDAIHLKQRLHRWC